MSIISKNYLKHQFGYWLNRLRIELNQSFEQKLDPYEMTISMWNIMMALFEEKATSVKSLAGYIKTDNAAISRTVEKLSERGYIIHKTGKDRRTGFIELTEKAYKLMPFLIKECKENERKFFGYLSTYEIKQFQNILGKVFEKIDGTNLDGMLIESRIEAIITESKIEGFPYPKFFKLLKEIGVTNYKVSFIEKYTAVYYGEFGSWQEGTPLNYIPLKLSGIFSKEAIKNSIMYHIQYKTDFIDFLTDISGIDCSHYIVCMKENIIRYYSSTGMEYHEESVPEWKKQLFAKTAA